ncbi:MAG: HAMP domain-containing protein, partial [Gemmataceae bacterium]|nr:HAMP domain-containing protein [Gemmataceae bacterium]
MIHFRDVSLRTKLYTLLIAYTVTMASILVLRAFVLQEFSIGGSAHRQLDQQKDVINDMVPPPLLVGRPFLTLHEIEIAADPAEVRRLTAVFKEYEAAYKERRDYWLARLPRDNPARQALETTAHQSAVEFFRLANEEYLPKARDPRDAAARAQATKVLREQLTPVFRDQSRLIQEAAKQEESAVEAERARAAGVVAFWQNSTLLFAALALAFFGLSGWALTRSISTSANVLLARVREMGSGAADLTARIPVEGRDEMAQLAEGINAVIARIQGIVGKARESSLQLLSIASQIAATARGQESTVNNLSDLEKLQDETAWCSCFMNWCVEQCNAVGTDSAWAKSWGNWRTSVPVASAQTGDIAVFDRSSAKGSGGHVAMFITL